jgi:hypothetical protein
VYQAVYLDELGFGEVVGSIELQDPLQ